MVYHKVRPGKNKKQSTQHYYA